MGKEVGCYHRFSYFRNGKTVIGEAVLFEPVAGLFYWLVLYISPRYRRQNLVEEIFEYIIATLPGWHQIHCSMSIPSFKRLSKAYGWQYLGRSEIFDACNAYLFVSRKRTHVVHDRRARSYSILKKRPDLRTIARAHIAEIISAIRDEASRRRCRSPNGLPRLD